MRVIKFRAWDVVGKFMLSATLEELCDIDNRRGVHFRADLKSSLKFDYIKVMQFTGLLDKNGKEIYEGDIVISRGISGDNGKEEVCFEGGAFLPFHGANCPDDDAMASESEVIGNIYENPELLEDLKC